MTPTDIDYVLNILRRGTIQWPGRNECLKRARAKVQIGLTKDGRPKYKFHWQCAACKSWTRLVEDIEVDHIQEVGGFDGDLNKYVSRLYCSVDNLQALCKVCHSKKTLTFQNARLNLKRKNQP